MTNASIRGESKGLGYAKKNYGYGDIQGQKGLGYKARKNLDFVKA